MILRKNKGCHRLPIYDVKELSVEQALNLLSNPQPASNDSFISRASRWFRLPTKQQNNHRLIESYFRL
jgi:hypothetical protein